MSEVDEPLLTIGEVTQLFGVTARTLRHYDSIGLVQPTARTWSGYRLYGQQDIAVLAKVVVLRRLEMPLADVAEALADGTWRERLQAHRCALEARRDELTDALKSIDQALEADMTNYRVSTEDLREIFGDGYDEAYEAEADAR